MDSPFQRGSLGERASRVLGFSLVAGDGLALLFLFLSLLVFFAPVIFGGEVFYFRDICQEIVPKRGFFAGSGLEVLWNPYSFFGLPHAANPQSSAFYPLNFLFYLGSAPRMTSLYILLHFVIALGSGYMLFRARSSSPAAAAIGSLAFAYGGFFVSLGNLAVVLNSATWIMALLWSADRALVTGRRNYLIGVGVFWSLQVLGGEPQIAALTGLVLGIYLLARSREPGAEAGQSPLLKRSALILGGGLLLALTLSAVQWFLTLELTALSNRAHSLDYAEAVKWSLEPRSLFTLFVPHYIMSATETVNWVLGFRSSRLPYLLSIYPGVLVLFLAGLGVLRGPRGRLILAGGALLFLWLSLGEAGGLYRAAYLWLPGFDRFRFPERCVYGFSVFLALLAAGGAQALAERLTVLRKNAVLDRHRFSRLPLLLLLLFGLAAVLWFRHHSLVLEFLELESWPAAQILGDHAAREQARSWLFMASLCRTAAVAALAVFLTALTAGRGLWRRGALVGLGLCLFADLYLAHRHVTPSVAPEFYSSEETALDRLPQHLHRSRGLILAPPQTDLAMAIDAGVKPVDQFAKLRRWLLPFVSLEHGIRDVLAVSSFRPADYDLWKGLFEEAGPEAQSALFSLSGVSWIVRVHPSPEAHIVEGPLPRAYVVPEARWFKDREQVFSSLLDPEFDPREAVLLEGATPERVPRKGAGLFWPMSDAERIIIEDANQRVSVMFERQRPGWLVLLDLHYPGWKARVNGEERPIYRANGFFRAVEVGAEGGVVEFFYWPGRFFAGLLVSLASLGFCLILLLRGRGFVLFWPLWFLLLVILPAQEGGTTNVPVGLLRIAVLVMAAAWTWKLMREKELPLFRTRLDLWIAGFWLLSGLSLLRSPYFFISFQWCLNIMTFILLFYFTIQFAGGDRTGSRRLKQVMGLAVAAALLQSLWAALEWRAGVRPATAGYFNPSFLAGSLMVISPYLMARGLGPLYEPGLQRILRALVWLGLFLVVVLGMVMSQSRALIIFPAVFLLAALPGLEGVLRGRGLPKMRARKISALLLAALVLLSAAAALLLPTPVRDRFHQQSKDPYAFERVRIWKAGLKMAADHPLGTGLGMFKYHSPRYKLPVEGVMAGRYEKEARTAHNEYLHLSVEMSPAAVLFLLIALGLLVRTAFTVEWASRPGLLAMSLAAGLVAIALHALFDSTLHEPAIAVLAAVLSGLLVTELSRQGKPMLVELQPGPWARRFLAGLFTGLLLLGVPGYAYLAWSFDHWVRALKEQDYNRELVLLDRAARHSFGNYQPYSHLALAKLRQYYYTRNARRLDDALKAVEQAERLNPVSSGPPALKGRVFLELFKGSGETIFLDYADTAFRRAAGLAPYDIDLVLARAEVSRHRGQWGLESEQLAAALALEPYDLGARLRLCRSLLSQGRAEEARQQWREFNERKLDVERKKKKRDRFFDSPYRARRIAGDPELEERLQSLLADP